MRVPVAVWVAADCDNPMIFPRSQLLSCRDRPGSTRRWLTREPKYYFAINYRDIMRQGLGAEDSRLHPAISEVLHYIWDPSGVAGVPEARDEYDGICGRSSAVTEI